MLQLVQRLVGINQNIKNEKITLMKKLYRYPDKGYLGGVCHGLAIHTNIDPILWRVLTVFSGFAIIYIILWIFVPKAKNEIEL